MPGKMSMMFLSGPKPRSIVLKKDSLNTEKQVSIPYKKRTISNRFNIGSNMKAKSNGCGCGGFR